MNIKPRPGINRDSITPTPTTSAAARGRQTPFVGAGGVDDGEQQQQEQEEEYDENITMDLSQQNLQEVEEDDDEEEEDEQEEPMMKPNSVKNTPEPPNRSKAKFEQPRAARTNAPTYKPESYDGGSGSLRSLIFMILAAVAIVVGLLTPRVLPYFYSADATKLTCSYEALQRSHPKQHPGVWESLTVGIENVLNKRSHMPGVYLFVHRGGESVQKLVKEIAATSSKCFGNKIRPVEMKAEDFTSSDTVKDYGHAIEKYKQKMKNGQVILIANLNEIPAEAARALHVICDTYNPIFQDVIIFLTLFTADSEGNPVQRAEDTLFDLWGSKLQRNELDPLITRVTDHVIALQS